MFWGENSTSTVGFCHLGGAVVNVLATGPKDYGFEPGQADEFLSVIKTRSTPSDRK
jgi:hypothetical protein